MNSLIGITGFAQVGKTTSAQWLCERWGYTEVCFADPLRELAERINPVLDTPLVDVGYVPDDAYLSDAFWTYASAKDELGYEKAKSILQGFRQFLKDLGNGVREVIGESTWVDAAMAKAKKQPTVISDVRFINEGNAIREAGGKLIRVVRPGYWAESDFEKEVPLIGTDASVVNDGSMGSLFEQLDEVMRTFAIVADYHQLSLVA